MLEPQLTGPETAVFTKELKKRLIQQGLVWSSSVFAESTDGARSL